MPKQLAPSLRTIPKNGEYGDANVFVSEFIAAATPIADVIMFAKMPAGCQILGVELINDALGTSSTLSIGTEEVASGVANPTALRGATASNNAGSIRSTVHPITLDVPTYITATIGGAAITGKVTALISYRFVGTK